MEVRERFLVEAEPGAVSALLLEVETVASCVPGVEDVTQDDDGSYRAALAVRLGPIKARFVGSLELDGADAPAVLRAKGKGRDRSTNSQVSVDMEATLVPEGAETAVVVVAQVNIRGRLGQFGTGLIQSTATEMTKSFATCLQGKLLERSSTSLESMPTEGAPASVPNGGSPGPSRSPSPKQPSVLLLVLRALWRTVRDLLARLLRRRSER